jgi:hypothetical protein
MYPVQFRLEEGNFAVTLAEIREWLSQQRIDPGSLNYQLDADQVRVRLEFTTPSHAAAFRAAFQDHLAPVAQQ